MIEVVTNYLDGALDTDEHQRFERHLSRCAGCNTYLDQIRETIRQTGMVPDEESLPPALSSEPGSETRTPPLGSAGPALFGSSHIRL
jgi:anti-sigma factor RsiW